MERALSSDNFASNQEEKVVRKEANDSDQSIVVRPKSANDEHSPECRPRTAQELENDETLSKIKGE